MTQPESDSFGEATLFEGEQYSVHKAAVGAAHAILASPLRLHQRVKIEAVGTIVYVGHDIKGNREHKVEITDIQVQPAGPSRL